MSSERRAQQAISQAGAANCKIPILWSALGRGRIRYKKLAGRAHLPRIWNDVALSLTTFVLPHTMNRNLCNR